MLLAAAIGVVWLLAACDGDKPSFDTTLGRAHTDLSYLRDAEGRYLHLRGANVGGSTKVPLFLEGGEGPERPFTYIGRPFPEEEADKWFAQLRDLGFNSIRLLWMWEAVYPDNPFEPDEEFLDYFDRIIAKAGDYGIYVMINCHENLWSRHLFSLYNENAPGKKGDLDNMLWSLFPPYTDRVSGDGAPLWATKLCLPEKNFDSPNYGTFNLLGTLGKDQDGIPGSDVIFLLKLALPLLGFDVPPGLLDDLEDKLPEPFPITDTAVFLPWTFWGLNVPLSIDMERCYAAFFAGDKVYPNVWIDEEGNHLTLDKDEEPPEGAKTIKDFLQDNFSSAWVEIAKRVKKYPHVIGYDIQNEPPGVFILLTAVSAYFQLGLDGAIQSALQGLLPMQIPVNFALPNEPEIDDELTATCDDSCARQREVCEQANLDQPQSVDCQAVENDCETYCEGLVGTLAGYSGANTAGNKIYYLLKFLELLPPDTSDATKEAWGFKDADLFAVAALNTGFGKNYLQPIYEKVGQAIQQEDPEAIIWIEPSAALETLLGGGLGGYWEQSMTRPKGLNQVVYSPHWYPDIYPSVGFNMPSREFAEEEFKFRDYTASLQSAIRGAAYSLSNVPVVFGEFGTYWNFRYLGDDPETPGYEQSREHDYRISAEIMDNFYESFESLFLSNVNWCYTTDNDPQYGDRWNKEDFSIIDENGEPRGEEAWQRPYPRVLSGKPVSMHFYSPLHYFDPHKGKVNPEREFDLVFESKETDAPTILYVPKAQYPEGFYLWLSDGWARWDDEWQWLYYYPERDEPDWRHQVTIRPPLAGMDVSGYAYFVDAEGRMVRGR